MKTLQTARFNMIEACIATAEANSPAWSGFAGFANPYNRLRTVLLPQLISAIAAGTQRTAPATAAKHGRRKKLEDLTLKLGLALLSYSSSTGDDHLKDDARVSATALHDASDAELIGNATQRLVLAEGLSANALSSWELGNEALAIFSTEIDLFIAAAGDPRKRRGEIRDSLRLTEALIGQIGKVLKEQLDAAVVMLRDAEPSFSSKWFSARKTLVTASRTRALSFRVTDAADGSGIAGVSIAIMPGNVLRSTSGLGRIWKQNLTAGDYTAVLSHRDYAEQVVSFSVSSGGTTEVSVKMERRT